YGAYALLIIIPCAILLAQPDFGMTCTVAFTGALLFFIVHFNMAEFLLLIGAAAASCTALIVWYPYRLRRIMIFLNPWNDPQGAGFQVIQSLIAIGSGGLWGAGIGASKQKFFYLPMQHTDFIFSIIAEETGFIGCTLLIMLFAAFTYYGMRIAWQMKNLFASLCTVGFVMLVTVQALINCSVALGLVPTKGVGLPFVSYGNSALISALWFVGIIIRATYASAYQRTNNYQPSAAYSAQ
ncbi:MAG: FtsW/RodA/SpoVE family cell cycle protein, partial [Candidatus Babeliales bacterium]